MIFYVHVNLNTRKSNAIFSQRSLPRTLSLVSSQILFKIITFAGCLSMGYRVACYKVKTRLRISTPKLMEYIQKNTHFKNILRCTFFKIPITHTPNMSLLCKLFSTAIHSMDYFCDVMRLYVDECKLTFLCLNLLGHYIMYFCSTLRSFVTSQLLYIL